MPKRDDVLTHYELETVPGLAAYARDELLDRFGGQVRVGKRLQLNGLTFTYRGNPRRLFELRCAQAVYWLRRYPIPRPKALLGHQHFQTLSGDIAAVQALHGRDAFQHFRISAAGEDSAVFKRLRQAIAAASGLQFQPTEADMLLRVRPSGGRSGWEVLTRLTPRPLSTRAWRVRDMPGALNATIAAVMIARTQPHADDRFLNLMCGSGTLLIERLLQRPAHQVVGGDSDPAALAIAAENVAAAGLSDKIKLQKLHAEAVLLPDESFDVICADLPWGQLLGSPEENRELYPRVLSEINRLAAPGARIALISHEVRLMEELLGLLKDLWQWQETIKITQENWRPRIYVIVKPRSA